MLGKDTVKQGQLLPSTLLLWNAAIDRARSRRPGRRRKRDRKRDLSALGSAQRS